MLSMSDLHFYAFSKQNQARASLFLESNHQENEATHSVPIGKSKKISIKSMKTSRRAPKSSACHSSPSIHPLCHDEESHALLQFKKSLVINESASSDPSAYPKVASWKV
uniref:Uncharacterized protein n=1 Tax=Salix viminalis TaxID=40686 RepID=A0A6N2MKB9_SALVM